MSGGRATLSDRWMRFWWSLGMLLPAVVLGSFGCSGSVASTGDDDDAGAAGSGGTSSSGGAGGGKVVGGVAPTTRVARLTHEQYKNTVGELLGVTDDPAAAFAPDALNGFDFDTSVDFRVDTRLGPQYRSVAEELAAESVSDPAIFAKIVACDASAPSCADEFVASFGARAFRRPLTTEESARYRGLFEQGAALVASGDAFKDGVRVVVEAALQSPKFLYRAELGARAGSDGLVALDSWELASRLSYALWNSMPDSALFESARAGELGTPEAVRAAADRLLADPRATAKAVSFHAQAWEFSRYAKIAPDLDEYPEAPADLAARARAASERFVREVVESGGGIGEMLTAPYVFADSELAPLYGATTPGPLARLDFSGGERKGLLMQVGHLASNAYSKKTDPIHRGLFVLRRLLCRTVPDPPAGASMTPLPDVDPPPRTTREEITLLTSTPNCVGCHSDINAPGFSFESFDAVGQERETENGVAVDTTGSFELDGAVVSFADAGELVEALAQSAEAKSCYAERLLEFTLGHALAAEEAPLGAALGAPGPGARALLSQITGSEIFRKRAPNEVGP
ncbi:MAG TPA: DUF1592 domain-containing protein [Polyangiaceae bacterium]